MVETLSCHQFSTFAVEPNSPPWWLKSGHLQTIFASIFSEAPKINYRRERWELDDADFLDIDFADGKPGAPWVIASHGLEGSSYSRYILRLMNTAQNMGWNAAVYNFRGCSGETNRLLRSYHSGDTQDLEYIIQTIHGRCHCPTIFLAGYSLGGNVIAKWLGEKSSNALELVQGAVLCCTPFDLLACQKNMDRGFNLIYVWRFLRTLRSKAKQRMQSNSHAIDIKRAMRAWTIREFDDAFTAPAHKFRDYLHYYSSSSSKPYLKHIKVPTLVIHAWDDPLIPSNSFPDPSEVSNQVLLRPVAHGGHIGFYDKTYKAYWVDRQIERWFRLLQKGKDHE